MAEITIIVPVYNAQAYLPACIESILGQTVPDFELFLVDDGSTDDSLALCRDYAARDGRITVLHQENRGQAAARNRAIAQSAGEWLCFVDSDDCIHPQTLELLCRGLEETGAAMAMCQMLEAETLPEDFNAPREPEWVTYPMDEKTLLALHDGDAYPGWVACAKLIRREQVEAYLFTPGRVYEDNEAVCRWLISAGSLAVTGEKLYFYRTNPASTTQKGFSRKRLDYLWALESILRFYYGLGYTELAGRFADRYARAAAGFYRQARQELQDAKAARSIRRNARRLFGPGGVPLTKGQFETMLDAMHPRLIRLYWPLEACVRNLRAGGLRGLAQAIIRQGRKERKP